MEKITLGVISIYYGCKKKEREFDSDEPRIRMI